MFRPGPLRCGYGKLWGCKRFRGACSKHDPKPTYRIIWSVCNRKNPRAIPLNIIDVDNVSAGLIAKYSDGSCDSVLVEGWEVIVKFVPIEG